MQFAMACIDRYRAVFESFIASGWKPVKLFSMTLDNRIEYNQEVIAYADRRGIDIQLSPIKEHDLADLASRGCKTLVVAGYGSLIPDWRPFLDRAINFHPSPLPEGRGRYPVIHAILQGRQEWAVTCHKISERFDRGDILAAETFPLQPDECHDTIDVKSQMAARRLAERIAPDLAEFWDNAEPQGKGTYWQLTTKQDRTLDFSASVETIMRKIRAFGRLETIAQIDAATIYVRQAAGWTEAHSHKPGTLVQFNTQIFVIAASDGYIILTKWSPISKEASQNLGR